MYLLNQNCNIKLSNLIQMHYFFMLIAFYIYNFKNNFLYTSHFSQYISSFSCA